MASEVVLKIAPVFDGLEDLEDQQELVMDHVTDGSEEEEDSEGDSKHENLLKEIVSLSSMEQKKQKASKQRSEPNQAVSEYNLSAITDTEQQVGLHDLIGSLQKSSEHGILKKKLDSMQRNSGTLDTPLPKPQMQKIQRTIAYEETSKDVEKWAPTVKRNREAEHLTFPLKPYQAPTPSLKSFAVNFKPRTPLEEEVAAVLKGSSRVLERNNKELTEAEEEALLAMDLEEAKERRRELQKLRALQSYYEAKCHRIRKIKSKKYHRIKRKAEKRAVEKSSKENVQDEDPTLAKEMLEKAERLRATERVSLKHRNTSKWAKQLIAKGAKNPETRRLLQDQLRISRRLTQKTEESCSSDEEMERPDQKEVIEDDEKQSNAYGNLLTSEDNPWRIETSKKGNSQETTSSFDHDSSTKLHRLKPITAKETAQVDERESEPTGEDDTESEEEFKLQPVQTVNENRKKKKLKKKDKVTKGTERKIKRKLESITDNDDDVTVKRVKKSKKTSEKNSKKPPKKCNETGTLQNAMEGKQIDSVKERGKTIDKKRHNIRPDDSVKTVDKGFDGIHGTVVSDTRHTSNDREEKNAGEDIGNGRNEKNRDVMPHTKSRDICVDPKKSFQIEDNEAKFDEVASDSLQQKRIDIQQAFANDDVAEEFVQEKDKIVEASKPKDIDLSLPGWGCWAGAGVKPSNKKKGGFIKKAAPAPPRKDKGLSHVIINEEKSKWLAKNQVSSIPHPFNNPVQFERSMRNPVGKHWNTSTVVNQLTKPRITTLIGTIIEPIKATKEIKKPRKEKNKGKESSGITIHS